MIDLVRRVCALQTGCRWTWDLEVDGLDRRALFLARAKKRGGHHRAELVTLLAPGQDNDAAYQEFPNRMILSRFLVDIYRIDARFTWLGICGR